MQDLSGAREFYYDSKTKTYLKLISEDEWCYYFLSVPSEISYSNSNNLFLEDTIKIKRMIKRTSFVNFQSYAKLVDEEVFLNAAEHYFHLLLDEDFNRKRTAAARYKAT